MRWKKVTGFGCVVHVFVSTAGVYVGARKSTALCVNLHSWNSMHCVYVYLYFWCTCSDLLPSGHPKENSSKQTRDENSQVTGLAWPKEY